jgi:hypothetical protein
MKIQRRNHPNPTWTPWKVGDPIPEYPVEVISADGFRLFYSKDDRHSCVSWIGGIYGIVGFRRIRRPKSA